MIAVLTPEAEADIASATEWLRERSGELPARFEAVVATAIADALAYPEAFLKIHRSVRRVLTRTFPYGVYYFIDGEALVVVGVIHQARHPSVLKRRRLR